MDVFKGNVIGSKFVVLLLVCFFVFFSVQGNSK